MRKKSIKPLNSSKKKKIFLQQFRPHTAKKISSRRKKVNLAFSLTSLLLAGTCLSGINYCVQQMDQFTPEKFPNEKIVLNNTNISHEEFYENLKKKGNGWYFVKRTPSQKTFYNLNKISDYRTNGDKYFNDTQQLTFSYAIDTINVKKAKTGTQFEYQRGTQDAFPNKPAYGLLENNGKATIRYFYSDTPDIYEICKYDNNEYNATLDHENQHFWNLLIRKSGQSYETKFAELCMDEVSANIRQLMRQRKNYIEHDYDLDYITDRFSFYRDWLKKQTSPIQPIEIADPQNDEGKTFAELNSQRIPAADNISIQTPWEATLTSASQTEAPNNPVMSEEEISVIANGVLQAWIEEKFEIYIAAEVSRARYILSNASYIGCTDHPKLHEECMRTIFTINGIDFYEPIAGKEDYFKEHIPEEDKKTFAEIMAKKKENVSYWQKVEQLTHNDPQQKNAYFNSLKQKHLWNKFLQKTLIGKFIDHFR